MLLSFSEGFILYIFPNSEVYASLFYLLFFSKMVREENATKTRDDLVKFITDNGYAFGDSRDYEKNIRVMADAVQFMDWNWYIEEFGPALSDEQGAVADYYDDVVHDIIIFNSEVYWRFDTIDELVDYLYGLNGDYEYAKQKYFEMYTVTQHLKNIFNLLTTK